MSKYENLDYNSKNNWFNHQAACKFTRSPGVMLLEAMPLVSLTNVFVLINIGESSIRVIDFLFVFLWFIMAILIFQRGRILRKVLVYTILVISFLLLSLLGFAFMFNYQVQWAYLLRFLETLLWGSLALFFVRSEKSLERIFKSIIVTGSILSMYSIYLFFKDHSLHRIAGFFSAAGGMGLNRQASFNEIGALYALAAVLAANYIFWNSRITQVLQKKLIVIGWILNVIGLILVQSRSAFFAFAIGLLTILFPFFKNVFVFGKVSRKAFLYTFLLLAATGIIIIISSNTLPINRISRTFIPGTNEYISAVMRIILWEKAFQVWLDRLPYFIIGYGFHSSTRLIGAESSENFFLDIGVWFGLLGITLMTAILILPIKWINDINRNQMIINASAGALLVALTVSITGSVLLDPFYGGCTLLVLYGSVAASFYRDD